ncbi:MAG: hypothetical protein ACKO1Y_01625 [Actinomycetota bacterium]
MFHKATAPRRATFLLALAAIGIASSRPAMADVKTARQCRKTLGLEAQKMTKAGLGAVDACNKEIDKVCTVPSGRTTCVTLPGLDVKQKYSQQTGKSLVAIDGLDKGKCRGVAEVTANYPGGTTVSDSLIPAISAEIEGTANAIDGVASLLCDKDLVKCRQAIGKARTGVIGEAVKNAVKCQSGIDGDASTFGKLDTSCVADPAPKAYAKGAASIQKACGDKSVTGADVGSCDPLPACVVDAALATGKSLAAAVYSQTGFVCGNGLIEGSEQCDDGASNGTGSCSVGCEVTGLTCNGSYAGTGAANGTRAVTISIVTPEPLSGVEINLDYPQFQVGIPGTGNSSIVNARAEYLQTADLSGMNDAETDLKLALVSLGSGFDSGDLVKVTFDNCVSASVNVCNRNQNVMNCCNSTSDPTQYRTCSNDASRVCGTSADCVSPGTCATPALCPANPPSCGTQPSGSTLGSCSNNGGCPGDNACVSQASILTCSVSSPTSLATSQLVSGVTCSVSIQEIP